jgi:hypothetical protein
LRARLRSASMETLASSVRTQGSRLLRPSSTRSLRGRKPDTTDAPPVPKLPKARSGPVIPPKAFSEQKPAVVHMTTEQTTEVTEPSDVDRKVMNLRERATRL